MVANFLRSFAVSAIGLLLVFSGLGYAASTLLFRAPAETFHLRGANFTIPEGWVCEKEDTEVVCGKQASKRDALIITTTQTISYIDTLERYREHLGTPQPITYKDGGTGMSEVRYVRTELYGGREWVDGMHHGSEVPIMTPVTLPRSPARRPFSLHFRAKPTSANPTSRSSTPLSAPWTRAT